jgi:hypothetical protein
MLLFKTKGRICLKRVLFFEETGGNCSPTGYILIRGQKLNTRDKEEQKLNKAEQKG